MSNEWRRVVATLADPARREVYAQVVLGVVPAASGKDRKRIRILDSLRASGLIERADDGSWRATSAGLERLLSENEPEVASGVERFLRNGRLDGFPRRATDRRELLAWVAARVVPGADVTVAESEINAGLAELTNDVATIRRYLVDEGLLVRDAAGSAYRAARPS